MCQEITIFAKFSYTFVFSILDFDFNFKPEDFELIAFFISVGPRIGPKIALMIVLH